MQARVIRRYLPSRDKVGDSVSNFASRTSRCLNPWRITRACGASSLYRSRNLMGTIVPAGASVRLTGLQASFSHQGTRDLILASLKACFPAASSRDSTTAKSSSSVVIWTMWTSSSLGCFGAGWPSACRSCRRGGSPSKMRLRSSETALAIRRASW